jgi:hypothetical protein
METVRRLIIQSSDRVRDLRNDTMVVKRFADRPYGWRTVVPTAKIQHRKHVVEECLVLSIKELFDKGLIANHTFHIGSWRWANTNIFQFNGAVRYEADLRNHEEATLRLQYEIDGLEMDYSLVLSSEDQGWLGPRWWFRCPLADIRVKKLYLPLQSTRFASRQAHQLIYPTCRRRRPIEDGRLIVLQIQAVTENSKYKT